MTETVKNRDQEYASRVNELFDVQITNNEEKLLHNSNLYELLVAFCAKHDHDYSVKLVRDLDKIFKENLSSFQKLILNINKLFNSIFGKKFISKHQDNLLYHVNSIRSEALIKKIGSTCGITDPTKDLSKKGLMERNTLQAILACLTDYMAYCATGLLNQDPEDGLYKLKSRFLKMFKLVLEIFTHPDNISTNLVVEKNSNEKNLHDMFLYYLNAIIGIKKSLDKSHIRSLDYANEVVDGLLEKLGNIKIIDWSKPYRTVDENRDLIAALKDEENLSKMELVFLPDSEVNKIFYDLSDKAEIKRNAHGIFEHYTYVLKEFVEEEVHYEKIIHNLHDTFLIMKDIYNEKYDFFTPEYEKLSVHEKNIIQIEKSVVDKILVKINDQFGKLNKSFYNMELSSIIYILEKEILSFLSKLSPYVFQIDMNELKKSHGSKKVLTRIDIETFAKIFKDDESDLENINEYKKEVLLNNLKDEIRTLITQKGHINNPVSKSASKKEKDIFTRTSYFFDFQT